MAPKLSNDNEVTKMADVENNVAPALASSSSDKVTNSSFPYGGLGLGQQLNLLIRSVAIASGIQREKCSTEIHPGDYTHHEFPKTRAKSVSPEEYSETNSEQEPQSVERLRMSQQAKVKEYQSKRYSPGPGLLGDIKDKKDSSQ